MEEQRYNYKLNADSVVFDVGGYAGIFMREIARHGDPRIFTFEPVSLYYHKLTEFESDKVRIFHYGVGDSDRSQSIGILGDSSSVFKPSNVSEVVQIRSLSGVIARLNISRIDLIKINIEGCEYELLDHILDTGLVTMMQNIQVQFHDFVPDAVTRRDAIRQRLTVTHHLTYDYPFAWENHEKNSSN
jgi:FkbM family methyltransferase